MVNILVVEDDENLNKSICLFLEQKGFNIQSCFDGEQAFDLLYKKSYDLIITVIMMPNVDGFQLVENVRQLNKDVPIIIMTAKEDFLSKQKGFNAGIDDYLVKPVDLQELYLRIKALLRRANINLEKKLVVGNFTMNLEEHSAYIDDQPINLTTREFNIILKFLSYPKKTFSRPQLMNEFWNPDSFTGTRTVDVYITKIREKLSACTGFEIVTVHGLGYKSIIKEENK
jgi:DNA-binding response OmpR family regulator